MGYITTELSLDTKIRRYMSLPKLEWLLDKQSIYFTRFDSFEDRLEGGIGPNNYSDVSNAYGILDIALNGVGTLSGSGGVDSLVVDTFNETFPTIFGELKKVDGDSYLQGVRSWLYASCWTNLPHECQAMWQLYGSSGANCRHDVGCVECQNSLGMSICLETTLGAVLENIKLNDGYNLIVREVEYLDHEKVCFDERDIVLRPFFSKALHFSYENELRFMLFPDRKDIKFSYKCNQSEVNKVGNVAVPVTNMKGLIRKIILSPLPFRKQEQIERIHMERYKTALGLPDALANETLRASVQTLCKKHNLEPVIVDSALNSISAKDFYSSIPTKG
ncbi:TPA: hypothetical protein ACGRX8_004099 [Pseudomonas aeruginosa]